LWSDARRGGTKRRRNRLGGIDVTNGRPNEVASNLGACLDRSIGRSVIGDQPAHGNAVGCCDRMDL
jgi:hypothetical protein